LNILGATGRAYEPSGQVGKSWKKSDPPTKIIEFIMPELEQERPSNENGQIYIARA